MSLKKTILSALIFSVASTGLAWAAGTAEIQSDGEINKLMWQDSKNIVFEPAENAGPFGKMIIKDGKAYAIQEIGGKVQVMETGGIMQAVSGLMEEFGEDIEAPRILALKDTKKTETVAGIKGYVYLVDIEEDGKEETVEAVFTDNKTVVEMTEVYMSLIESMMGEAFGKALIDYQNSFPKNRKGLLRLGDDIEIVKVNDQKPDNALFELPAKPISLQNLMKQFQ